MSAQITETASLAPGTCLLSGDFNGPFLDTGKSIRGHGRVYLSLKALGPLMREAGWKPEAEVEGELARIEQKLAKTQALEVEAESYRGIVEALRPFLPEPEPIERQVAIYKDPKVRDENTRLTEQVRELKAQLSETQAKLKDASTAPAPVAEETKAEEREVSLGTVEVKGQEVDLTDLLSQPIDTIVSVVSRTPELIDPVLEAEKARAEAVGKRPRVTLRTRLEELR